MSMYQATEQWLAFNRAQLETAERFAGLALEGAEKLLEVQLHAARSACAEGIENARALAAVKNLQDLAGLRESLAQPSVERATAYARSVYDAAADTHARLGALIDEQVADFNQQVVTLLDRVSQNAPAGSEAGIAALKSGIMTMNAAYETFAKVTRQVAQTARANMEATGRQAASEARKGTKKAA
jgi:phasin family protein